jgi:hypothetical protein
MDYGQGGEEDIVIAEALEKLKPVGRVSRSRVIFRADYSSREHQEPELQAEHTSFLRGGMVP